MIAGAHLAAQQVYGAASFLTAWDNAGTFAHLEWILLCHCSLLSIKSPVIGVRVRRYHRVLKRVHKRLLHRHVRIVLVSASSCVLDDGLLLGKHRHTKVELGCQLSLGLLTAPKLV